MNNKGWEKTKLPREIASEAKKKHIYRTAIELFREYGYDNITLKDISKKSGMSEGSIYNFFGSKVGILSDFRKKIYNLAGSLIEINELTLANPKETIISYLLAQGSEFNDIGFELTNRFYNNVPFEANYNDLNQSTSLRIANEDKQLLDFIVKAMDVGTIKASLTPEEMTSTLSILCNGLVNIWTLHSGSFSLLEASERIFRNYLDSFC